MYHWPRWKFVWCIFSSSSPPSKSQLQALLLLMIRELKRRELMHHNTLKIWHLRFDVQNLGCHVPHSAMLKDKAVPLFLRHCCFETLEQGHRLWSYHPNVHDRKGYILLDRITAQKRGNVSCIHKRVCVLEDLSWNHHYSLLSSWPEVKTQRGVVWVNCDHFSLLVISILAL